MFERHELADSDDPSFLALSLILAAWDEGTDNGVAPEQMAYAALFTGLEKRIAAGEFTMNRTIQ